MDYDIGQIKNKSIVDYLEKSGKSIASVGNKFICRSPFSSDSNPSFIIYPSNTFYDWSTGIHGDIIDLVCKIEKLDFVDACKFINNESISDIQYNKTIIKNNARSFKILKYLNEDKEECRLIDEYAKSRSIIDGYYHGKFYDYIDGKWIRNPAMMFLHSDYNGNICGAKFRVIDSDKNPRFSARGALKYYILENNITDDNPTLFLVESETSANSLWMVLQYLGLSGIVICFGAVSSPPVPIPFKYEQYKNRKLIIDYDGDEEKYQIRLQRFTHLEAIPIKMELPKGQDLNSLYVSGELERIISYL